MATELSDYASIPNQTSGTVKGLGLISDLPVSPETILISGEPSSLPPPPYATAALEGSPLEKTRPIDNMLYQKMLSLESMVSTIHESVVDQGTTYIDVASQLKEIQDSMSRFQQEASIRLRKKLAVTGSLTPSAFSEFSLDCDQTIESSGIASCTDSFDKDEKETAEETIRYQRVCSLLESLITDASSVLDSTPLPEDIALPEEDEDDFNYSEPANQPLNQISRSDLSEPFDINNISQEFDNNAFAPDDVVEVKFYCQVTKGGSQMQRHELSQRFILPLLNDAQDVDVDRLALLPSLDGLPDAQRVIHTEFDNQLLPNILFDNVNSAQKMVISLLYWTFLFTVGSILFDSALCNMAGFQVVTLLNSISGASPPTRNRSQTLISHPVTETDDELVPQNFSPLSRRRSL